MCVISSNPLSLRLGHPEESSPLRATRTPLDEPSPSRGWMGSIHSLTPVATVASEHILFGHQLVVQSGGEMLPPSQSGQRI